MGIPAIEGTEHAHQVALFQWAGTQLKVYPELKYLHAVPNGGHRHPVVAKKLKAEGVKRGVVDVFLDVPCGRYHGFRAELKVGKNQPTKEQKEWIAHYIKHGYHADVYWGWSALATSLINYIEQGRRKAA